MMNQLMNQQQNNNLGGGMMKLPQFSSTINSSNAYDEMSMMLGNFQNQLPSLQPGFNPFGTQDMSHASSSMFGGLNSQIPP